MCRGFADPWPCSEGTGWSCHVPWSESQRGKGRSPETRLLPASRSSSGATPPSAPCLPPSHPGRRLSAGLPSFPCGRCHKRTSRSKGGRRVAGPAVLSPVVEGLHRLPPPSLILSPTLVWAPARAERPQHLLPIISHSSWQALLEEKSSGEEESILFTGFQSIAMAGASQKEGGGGGGVTFEDREMERPADLSSCCPSSAAYSTPRTRDGAGLISLKFIYLSICTGS